MKLIISFDNFYFDVANEIINFYGDDKKNMMWQLDIVIKNNLDPKSKLSIPGSSETPEELESKKKIVIIKF